MKGLLDSFLETYNLGVQSNLFNPYGDGEAKGTTFLVSWDVCFTPDQCSLFELKCIYAVLTETT